MTGITLKSVVMTLKFTEKSGTPFAPEHVVVQPIRVTSPHRNLFDHRRGPQRENVAKIVGEMMGRLRKNIAKSAFPIQIRW